MTAPADPAPTTLAICDPDTAAIPVLADLQPAAPDLMDEVRNVAGMIASTFVMLDPRSRVDRLVHNIDAALADGGRPERTETILMLLVPLLDPDCRAAACSRIGTGDHARPHLGLWLQVARFTLGAPPERLPLTVAGFAAARAGANDLARDCFDRAMKGDPALADTRAYRDALDRNTAPQLLHPHYPPLP